MNGIYGMGPICVCCGNTVTDGTNICRKCVREIEKRYMCVRRSCKNWNRNGLFCELTGLDCIGLGCQSYEKTED